jgi:hypothetical protein
VRTPRGRDIDAACGQLKTAAERSAEARGSLGRHAVAASPSLGPQVRATFNDQSKGEKPTPASDDALFPPRIRDPRVHGDVTSMMVGGIAALLTQMLHPKALAGVWDHSDVEEDQLGRLRRTAPLHRVTTFGHRDSAHAAIERVKAIHEQVRGKLFRMEAIIARTEPMAPRLGPCGWCSELPDGWRR